MPKPRRIDDDPDVAQARKRELQRRAKISAAHRGRPKPPHVIEKIRKANTGRKLTPERIQKRLESAKLNRQALGSGPNRIWTAEDDELVHMLSPADAAQALNRTVSAVLNRRHKLGIRSNGTSRAQQYLWRLAKRRLERNGH